MAHIPQKELKVIRDYVTPFNEVIMAMKWPDVRKHYPDQIVLVEALKTSSENSIRTIEEMSILSHFEDSITAWKEYTRVHKENPDKELYVFHTSKEKPEVIEQFFVGVRGYDKGADIPFDDEPTTPVEGGGLL